jgi:hypothetical protein
MPIHDWTRVGAGIFHDFHQGWISTLSGALNSGVLSSDHYALIEPTGGAVSNALTLEHIHAGPSMADEYQPAAVDADRHVISLHTAPPKVRFTATAETERYARKRSRIAVRHSSGDQVVAMLEIVSPGNKSTRHGLRSFVEKAVELLDAGIHLLVVDLFPPGARDPQGIHSAIWSEIMDDDFQLPPDEPLTLAAYSSGEVKQAFIEPAATGEDLPDMPLFLEPDVYVPVPLEATYKSAFDAVPKRWQEELGPARAR